MTGNPTNLLHAIAETPVKGLTYIANNIGEPGLGGGRLLRNGQIKKAIGSFFTSNPEVVTAFQNKEIDVELLPQGNLCEAIRAGGAGLGGFFSPSSAGTLIAKDRETRLIEGKEMVFIPPLHANIALIRAWKADTAGNLQYRMTENNFNQTAATAADLVIVEVEKIVQVGELDPNFIHTPGCFVDYLVLAKLDVNDLGSSAGVVDKPTQANAARLNIAQAALNELRSGEIVNVGIGIPTLVAELITPAHNIVLHTENGLLGVGPTPESGGAMNYPVNAGKMPVSALPGASYFDSTMSFAMIRGGHIDVAIMGGLQVDESATLANWAVPGKPLLGVGGAMDLSIGARRLIITMTHTNKDGASKIVATCTLPVTANNVVDTIITDLAIFRFTDKGLSLVKVMPGSSLEEIANKTDAQYQIALES